MTGQVVVARHPSRAAARRALLPAGGLPAIWAERDELYAKRKVHQALTARDVLVVREARIREAGTDPVAATLAARWTPPERER